MTSFISSKNKKISKKYQINQVKIFIVVLLSLHLNLTQVNSLYLLPEPQNSLVDEHPYAIENSKITLSFSFPSTSIGLSYGEYFGIKFPGYEFQFTFDQTDLSGIPKYTCSLRDSKGRNYTINPVVSKKSDLNIASKAESSIAYCQLMDSINPALEVGEDIIYRLGITSNDLISYKYVSQIELFTSTSNTVDKIVIDKMPSMGRLLQLETYKRPEYKLLEIASTNITPTTGSCSISSSNCKNVYPYDEFSISFRLKSKTIFSTLDNCIIMIKLPYESYNLDSIKISSSSVSSTTGESSSSSNTTFTPLASKPNTNLNLEALSNGRFIVSNIGEDLPLNREFNLEIKGIKTLDKKIGIQENLEVLVYWKNSYSILSYDSAAIFKIEKVTVSYPGDSSIFTGIGHPEYWEVYENAAWPVRFVFTVNSNLINGGYLLIRQSNTQEMVSKVNFVASTCDFSENSLLNSGELKNSLESRPVCFPLLRDFAYSEKSASQPYNGSGVFFKVGQLKKGVSYTFTVWLYADSCGSFNSSNLEPDPTSGNTNAYTIWNFTYTLYKDIDQTKLGENVFKDQVVLASSSNIPFNNKCWGDFLESSTTGFLTHYKSVTRYPESISTNKKDILMFKELYDFNLGKINDSEVSCTNCFLTDVTSYDFNNKYYYSTIASEQMGESNFLLKASIRAKPYDEAGITTVEPSNYVAASYIPLPLYSYNDGGENRYAYLGGKLSLQFSYKYFVPTTNGLDKCFVSWANVNDKYVSSRNTQTKLTAAYGTTDGCITENRSNLLTSSCTNDMIDTTNSYISNINVNNDKENPYLGVPASLPKTFKILSTNNSVTTKGKTTQTNWSFLSDTFINPPSSFSNYPVYELFLYSNCLKSRDMSSIINKSLFTYFDFQIKWLVENNSGEYIANRVIRMIKLLPEGGIFNNWNKFEAVEPDPVRFHYSFNNDSLESSICLIEISGASLTSLLGNSSSIVLFLSDIALLETDRTSLVARYPIAPLIDNTTTYGFSSQLTNTSKNFYTYDKDETTLLEYIADELSSSVNPKSAYHFLMGSMIIIDNIKGVNITSTKSYQQSLIIPYYCPIKVIEEPETNSIPTSLHSVFIGSINIINKDLGNIKGFNKLLTDSTENLRAYLTSTTKSSPSNSIIHATLRFRAFNYNNERNDYLYVYNGTLKTKGTNTLCSGFLLFLNIEVKIDKSNLNLNYVNSSSEVLQLALSTYESNSTFYAYGKPFNKALFHTSRTQFSINSNTVLGTVDPFSFNSNNLYYTGIIRPELDKMTNRGFNDMIGFSCASTNNNVVSSLTNYMYNSEIVRATEVLYFYSFIVDYTPDNSAWTIDIVKDFPGSLYANDKASNVRIDIKLPINLPKGSQIVIGSQDSSVSNFKQSTTCSIANPYESIDKACSLKLNDAGFLYTQCKIPDSYDMINNNMISVCCYNVKFSLNDNNFYITDLKAIIDYDTSFSGFLSSSVSSPTTKREFSNTSNLYIYSKQFTLDNQNALVDIESARINKINYFHVTQNTGYGFVSMELILPREPPKNVVIQVTGDFSQMYIKNTKPLCFAIFSSSAGFDYNFLNKDFIRESTKYVDSCYVSNLSAASTVIKVSVKSIIFKCGNSFSLGKNLIIILGPIQEIDFSLGAYVGKTYEIIMIDKVLNENLSKSGATQLIQPNSKLADAPNLTNYYDNLCPIKSIFPRIVDELGSYEIVIDLTKTEVATAISNASKKSRVINEISIFFSDANQLILFENSLSIYQKINNIYEIVNYELTFLDILNISISVESSATEISISIAGVRNKYLDVGSVIPCTLNFFNLSSKERLNIITGTGTIGDLPLYYKTASASLQGNLRIENYSESYQLQSGVPRESSEIKVKITPDTTLGLAVFPLDLKSKPFIILTFKFYYYMQFYSYDIIKNPVSITQWIKDIEGNIVKSQDQPIIDYVKFHGNQVIIQLINSEWSFPKNFMYWEISIQNIKTPQDAIQSGGIDITLSNLDYSAIFRVYTNFESSAWQPLKNPEFDLLKFSRGKTFEYRKELSIIDVVTSSSVFRNYITVSPGIFHNAIFKKREININLVESAKTTISLHKDHQSREIAMTDLESYDFYLSSNNVLEFKIAVKCSTPNGTYMIDFLSTNSSYPLSIVFLKVLPNVKGQIKLFFDSNLQFPIDNEIILPIGGNMIMYYSLQEKSFDDLNLKWVTSKLATKTTIQTTAIESNSLTGRTKLINTENSNTTDTSTIFKEEFAIESPNDCYDVFPSKLNVTFDGKPLNITNLDFFNNFTRVQDGHDDEQNILSFRFTSSYAPIKLSCVLYCDNMVYELDGLDLTDPLKYTDVDYLVKYYYYYYYQKNQVVEFSFDNLVRGQDYNFACKVESTVSNSDALASYQIENSVLKLFIDETTKKTTIKIPDVEEERCLIIVDKNQGNDTVTIGDEYITKVISDIQLGLNRTFTTEVERSCSILVGPNNKTDYYVKYQNAPKCVSLSSGTNVIEDSSNKVPVKYLDNGKYYRFCVFTSINCRLNPNAEFINSILKDFAADPSNLQSEKGYNLNVELVDNKTIDIKDLTISNFTISEHNKISLNASYPFSVTCKFSINLYTVASTVTANNIKECNLETNFCGEFNTGYHGSQVNITLTNIKPLTYYFWVFCHSQKKSYTKQSETLFITSFGTRIYIANTDPDLVGTDQTSASSEVTDSTNSSSVDTGTNVIINEPSIPINCSNLTISFMISIILLLVLGN